MTVTFQAAPANGLRVGVTGATGGLGTRLLAAMLDSPATVAQVKVLVRDPAKLTAQPARLEVVVGELSDPAALGSFARGLDVCVHLASQVGYCPDPQQYVRTNVHGTEQLCQALLRASPDCHVIQCSSLTVLLRHKRLTFLNTAYANSKFKADEIVRRYREKAGLRSSIIYPGLIYGPGDRSFVPTVAQYLRSGRIPFYLQGGEAHGPVIYVDDLCELFQYVMTHPAQSVGEEFIGVGPQEAGIHDFLDSVAARCDTTPPKRRLPKAAILPAAIAIESVFQALHSRKAPPLHRRAVNLLSISLSPLQVERFNQGRWRATTGMHTGLNKAFVWYSEQGLI